MVGFMAVMSKSLKQKQNNTGFTLLEVLLSVAIIALIAGLSIPVYQTLQLRNELDIAAVTAAQTLRRAQVLSQAVEGDANWGVYAQSGSITLFQGASYAGRDSGFDEVFNVPTTITPSGTQEFVYSKFSGLPQSTGALTFTSDNDETRNITINEKGTITY